MTNKVQGISREEFKLDFRYLKWCTPAKKSYKKQRSTEKSKLYIQKARLPYHPPG